MKFDRRYSLKELGQLLKAETIGDESVWVDGLNEIHSIQPNQVVFVDHSKYYEKALNSQASIIIIDKQQPVLESKGLIVCDEPFDAFNFLIEHFGPKTKPEAGKPLRVGANTQIGENVFVGEDVSIGNDCTIFPGVSLLGNVTIGDRVVIQSGTVVGSHGFYYKKKATGHKRFLSGGEVILEDDVEIGANCTIDKGVTAATIIGEGTKIDNLVQIGHDTVIGKNCLIASQCGISGCVILEDDVTLWGQVGTVSGIRIGKGAVLQGRTVASKDLEPNKTYFGFPAEEARVKMREMAAVRRLPDFLSDNNTNLKKEA